MTPRPEHPDPVDLVRYSRGDLSRERARAVRVHCTQCEACGDQLAAVILLRRRAGAAGARRWAPAAAVAAAATLVLAMAGWWLVRAPATDPGGTVESLDDTQGVSALAPEERGLAAMMGRLAGDSTQVAREISSRNRLLGEAASRWLAGDPAGVIEVLAPFADQYDPIASPVLAVALHRAGEPAGLPLLKSIVSRGLPSDGAAASDSYWLYSARELGLALHAAGETTAALAMLDDVVSTLSEERLSIQWGRRVVEAREQIRADSDRTVAEATTH